MFSFNLTVLLHSLLVFKFPQLYAAVRVCWWDLLALFLINHESLLFKVPLAELRLPVVDGSVLAQCAATAVLRDGCCSVSGSV